MAEVFWNTWKSKLRRSGASYDEATEASEDLAGMNPAPYPNEHLGVLMKIIAGIHKRKNQEQLDARHSDVSAAKAATDPRCECGQGGMVVRYRHAQAREGKGTDAAGTQYVCHCTCPMGQWMRLNLDSEHRRLFVNLAAYPAIQVGKVAWSDEPDNQFRYHPDDWDGDMGCPVAPPNRWREHVNMLRAEGMESLRKHMAKHEPRPNVPRRARIEPAAYREPTAEERERAEAIKAEKFTAPQPVGAAAETPPF